MLKPSDKVKDPEAFEKKSVLKTWKESLNPYLNSQFGQASVPVSYITREDELPLEGLVYASVHDELVYAAIQY
jgi:hypothetical protein